MPIYEYRCQTCSERFEKLVRSRQQKHPDIHCPACQSADVQRLISAPAVHTGSQSTTAQDTGETTPAQPALFGRKELNQVLRNKDK